jgi:phosphatidylglycerol lysyltransferase
MSRRWINWSVRLVAVLTALMGVINMISAVTPNIPERVRRLREISPLSVQRGGHLTAALAGFALLLLATNLWRRKRVAWLLTLVVLIASAAGHLLKGLDYEEALLSLALALWLIYLQPHFHARSDPPSVQQGIRTLVVALLFTLAYGTTGFYLLDHHFQVNFGLGDALRQTVVMFTQFYDPGLEPITGFGRYFAASIYLVGAATLGYASILLVRPVLIRQPATAAERKRARKIVEAYGHTSLARLALLDDKHYYFSPGDSVIAYVVQGRFAVALGDPIGPPDDLRAAITSFQEFCARNDWQPAFYQTRPETIASYQAAGFKLLCIGHEGIVDLASFTLEGRDNKGLRSAYNRLVRLGYTAEVIQPPLAPGLMKELREVSDEWLARVHGTEMRFSLGWFDDDYIRNGLVVVVRHPEGGIAAFANIVPEYQANENSIDLMRYRQTGEHGLIDFLFVSLFNWARQAGLKTFNLGLSALSGIGEKPQDPAIERTLHFIYEHVDQFYNFKGLHEFKEKFHPTWSPRYLAYPGTASLPLVALALFRADAGDNWLSGYIHSLRSAG